MTLLPLPAAAVPMSPMPLALPPAPAAVPIQAGFGALFAALVGGGTPAPAPARVPAPVLTVVPDQPVVDEPTDEPTDAPEQPDEPAETPEAPVLGPALAAQIALAAVAVHVPAPDRPEPRDLIPVEAPDAPAPAPAPAAPVTAPTTPTGVAVPTPTLTPVATPEQPEQAEPVTRQVFPEITRLASRPDGTHRVTLQLSPEALGDVRVVLTVRDGAVHVRLAAGDDAQHALREGAPELRRLLEAAGAADTRIVVRDLGSAPGATAPSNAGTTTSHQPLAGDGARGGSGSTYGGQHSGPDQHAGTRGGGSTARDGTHDGTTRPRHVDQVARARTTGLDVTV